MSIKTDINKMDKKPEVLVDAGWAWVALLSAIVINAVVSTAMCSYGVLYIELLQVFGEGGSRTSLVGALSSSFLCLLSPITTVIIKRYGSRLAIFSGAIISAVGLGLSCFVTSLDVMTVTAGAVVGIGWALTFTGCLVNITYYFQRWRNLAVAILYVVIGVGMFVAAPYGFYLLEQYGLYSTFLILSAMHVQLCVCAVLCRPSPLELKTMSDNSKKELIISKEEVSRSSRIFNVKIFTNVHFVLFLLHTIAWNFAYGIGHQHLPNYLAVNDADSNEISFVFKIFAVSNTAGRLMGALVSARPVVDPFLVSNASEFICGLASVLFFLYANKSLGRVLFAAQLGLMMGLPNTTMMPIAMPMVDRTQLSEAISLVNLSCGMGVFLGPYIAGFIYDVSSSYNYSFVTSGIVLLLGSGVGTVCQFHYRRVTHVKKRELEVDTADEILVKLNNQQEIDITV